MQWRERCQNVDYWNEYLGSRSVQFIGSASWCCEEKEVLKNGQLKKINWFFLNGRNFIHVVVLGSFILVVFLPQFLFVGLFFNSERLERQGKQAPSWSSWLWGNPKSVSALKNKTIISGDKCSIRSPCAWWRVNAGTRARSRRCSRADWFKSSQSR